MPTNSNLIDEPQDVDDFDAQESLDDFVLTLPTNIRKMMSLVIMKSFMDRQKYGKEKAATEAASMMGFNERTVRRYMEQFMTNKGELPESKQGKYERMTVYCDEKVCCVCV